MSTMLLLNSPQVEVLVITPGAVFPLARTYEETRIAYQPSGSL